MQIQLGAVDSKPLLDNCSGQSLQSFCQRTRRIEKGFSLLSSSLSKFVFQFIKIAFNPSLHPKKSQT
jgi:hypothetical protein